MTSILDDESVIISRKQTIARDKLYPSPDEIDYHQLIYEDVILSLFYQYDAIQSLKMEIITHQSELEDILTPMSGEKSTNSNTTSKMSSNIDHDNRNDQNFTINSARTDQRAQKLEKILQDQIKERKYKPLTKFFIEQDKLTETINNNDICNELLTSMSPGVMKFNY